MDVSSYPLIGGFPRLHSDLIKGIDAKITLEDIKEAIYSMGALRAPGPDRFHTMFFQSQWDTISDSVCNFIKN